MLLEVLPLEHGAWMDLADAGHERLDHRVVGVAAEPRVAPAHVQRVVEQRRAVRAHVERHGERHARVDPRRRGIQGQLADRDTHAAGALVAEAEDPLVVGHDDEPDLVPRRVAQDLRDVVHVVGGDPDAARATVQVAELLARTADGGRVDDGQQLLQVVEEDAVEQRLVAVLEGREADVPLEVVGLVADVLQLEADLLVDVDDARREEPAEAEGVALILGERGVLVEDGIGEQREPAQDDRRGPAPVRSASSTGVQTGGWLRRRAWSKGHWKCLRGRIESATAAGADRRRVAERGVHGPRPPSRWRASRRARTRCPAAPGRRPRPRDPMMIVS